jgi:hypothetical protein
MELEHLLCLNGCPVPVERRTMDFEDINLCCDGDKDDEDFVLLDLKAGAQVTWLQKFIQKHLKVNNKFWRERHGELPLVQEMRKAIDTGKRGLGKTANRRTGVIVGIKVRDKVVLVQHTKGLVLAAYAGQEKEAIRWFLEEIENDVKLLGPVSPGRNPRPGPQQRDSQVDDDDPAQVIIDTVLSEIRGHPQCHDRKTTVSSIRQKPQTRRYPAVSVENKKISGSSPFLVRQEGPLKDNLEDIRLFPD